MSEQFTLYSTPWCGYCHRLKSQLQREGIEFSEVDIEQDPASAEIVMQAIGGNQTVPTLVFADGTALTNPSLAQVKAKGRTPGPLRLAHSTARLPSRAPAWRHLRLSDAGRRGLVERRDLLAGAVREPHDVARRAAEVLGVRLVTERHHGQGLRGVRIPGRGDVRVEVGAAHQARTGRLAGGEHPQHRTVGTRVDRVGQARRTADGVDDVVDDDKEDDEDDYEDDVV